MIVKKPGTAGYERAPAVAMQGHLDMVCVKAGGVVHDYTKDPIKIIIEGDQMHANGTTLGADDGIGVACMMAVLESTQIAHPPIEAIFTSDEEDGMSGAANLNTRHVTARRLINIDAEEERKFFYGCAGSLYADIKLPVRYVSTPRDAVMLQLSVSGLMGGHSGLTIHENRANANRLMSDLQASVRDALVSQRSWMYLADLTGGTFYNAIPGQADALVAVQSGFADEVRSVAAARQAQYNKDYPIESGKIVVSVKEPNLVPPATVMDQNALNNAVTIINSIPNGVIAMSQDVPGLVETSSNLGLLSTEQGSITVKCMIRSCVESKKDEVAALMERVARGAGATLVRGNESPAWDPNPRSPLKALFEKTYQAVFGEAASTTAIQAGLECGYFAKQMPGIDLLAIGPTITGAHSYNETLYLPTVDKIVRLLLAVLSDMK